MKSAVGLDSLRLAAGGFLLLLACGCADLDTPLGPVIRPQSKPTISGVTPRQLVRGVPATVTVSGTGFLPDFSAFVTNAERDTPAFAFAQVTTVHFVDVTRVRLDLPGTLPAGFLDVTIINQDDGLVRSRQALTVTAPVQKDGAR